MQARTPDSLESPSGATGNGKTAQSYIAGIGASGALLAGAVVTFVFLVGTVSFEVWPAASNGDGRTDSLGVAELSSGGDGSAGASLGATVALIADAVPSPSPQAVASKAAAPKATGGLEGQGGGSDDGSGGTDDGSGGSTGGGSDGGTAGGDPGGDPGSGGGDNDESDRPTASNPRPDRAGNGNSGNGNGNGNGSNGNGTATTPPGTGAGDGSDRPSAGDRGRGR